MNTSKINQVRIMSILLCVLLVFGFAEINGQKIDSLEKLLNVKTGLARYEVLFNLGYEYVDYSAALCYANLAFQEAKKSGDSLSIVQCGRLLALAFRRMGEIDSSIIVSVQVFPIARRSNHIKELKNILNGLAIAYTLKAYYDKALKIYFESLDLKEAPKR